MKVDSLRLKQFSVFEDVELVFSPGINVFLGTNGTGKSHAMKALYAPLKAIEESAPEAVNPLACVMKLRQVFKPDRGDLNRLVRRVGGPGGPVADVAGGASKGCCP